MRAAILIVSSLVLGVVAVGLATAASAPPNLDRALDAQRRLVAERPEAAAWNDLGNLLLLAGRGAEAEDAYVRALELRPADVTARFNLAVLLQQSGEGGRAAEQYEHVLDLDPSHAWARYQLGVLAEARGQRSTAIEHYARAFALDPRLSFPENNPHVIDNGLMTEALLHVERYADHTDVAPPREFGDASRIADLLLGGEPPVPGAPASDDVRHAGAPHGAAETPQPPRPPVPGEAGSVAGGAAPAGAAGGVTLVRPTGEATTRIEPTTTTGETIVAPRRVDSESVDPERGGRTRPERTTEPSRTIVVPPITTGQPTAPPRGRFRPGSASTGHLDLELVPEPTDRLASAYR